MTTVVKVEAHCDPKTTEVHITKTGVGGAQETVLQDGESAELTCFDLEMIRVREVPIAHQAEKAEVLAGDPKEGTETTESS